MPDVQDFDYVVNLAIDNDVRRNHEFAGSSLFPWPPEARKRRQLLNPVENDLCSSMGRAGVFFTDAFDMSYKLVRRSRCPANSPHD